MGGDMFSDIVFRENDHRYDIIRCSSYSPFVVSLTASLISIDAFVLYRHARICVFKHTHVSALVKQ